MRIFYDDRMRTHMPGDSHAERKERIERSKEVLDEYGIPTEQPKSCDEQIFQEVHDGEYLQQLRNSRGYMTADTVVRDNTYKIAALSAFCALIVGDALLHGENAFALNRPPGHHACRTHGGGFCYLNNVAIAAWYLKNHGMERIFILDWDCHHGNGTQEAFYDVDWVYYLSLHQKSIYPLTGYEFEKGEGSGEGYTLNIPVPKGAGDSEYLQIFDEIVVREIEEYDPDCVLISTGQDAHRKDPLSALNLSKKVYGKFIKKINDYPLGAVLEGGYDVDSLAYANFTIIEEMRR